MLTTFEKCPYLNPFYFKPQIQPIENTVACDSEVLFNISHTVENSNSITMYYQVVARGNLIENGQHEHAFGEGSLAGADESFEEQSELVKN